MTNIRITEADVGRKFRLRNGDIIEVTEFNPEYFLSVKGSHKLNSRNWSPTGMYVTDDVDGFDIVERLPKESHKVTMDSLLKSAKPFGSANPKSKAPTMTASNGEIYPVQYWTTQQRFSDRTPSEGVDIIIQGEDLGHLEWMKGVAGKYDIELHKQDLIAKSATWTIAPTPAVEKVDAPIWDEYMIEDEFFFGDYGLLPSDLNIKKELRRIDALHAWKNHVLSQHKGES